MDPKDFGHMRVDVLEECEHIRGEVSGFGVIEHAPRHRVTAAQRSVVP